MSLGAIHQFVPSFAGRDAIGRHVVAAQHLLRGAGFQSDIFAGESRRDVAHLASPYQRFDGTMRVNTALLYQCSTGSPVGLYCRDRPEPMLIDYHNITPASMFDAWEPHVGVELAAGRSQLAELAPDTIMGLADSSYNAEELTSLGCPRSVVVPILLDESDFVGSPDRAESTRLQRQKEGSVWLFVGRLAPNKAQHHLIAAFAAYVRYVDAKSRLYLVGGSSSHRYEVALHDYAVDLGIAARVVFAASVSHEALLSYYDTADVFVCLSDHEGFCVPLIEAMHRRLPIVAFQSSAVPETLGKAGILLSSKEPLTVATAVERLMNDSVLRASLVAAGLHRAEDFSLSHTSEAFMTAVSLLASSW